MAEKVSLNERADALERKMSDELDVLISKSALFNMADGNLGSANMGSGSATRFSFSTSWTAARFMRIAGLKSKVIPGARTISDSFRELLGPSRGRERLAMPLECSTTPE